MSEWEQKTIKQSSYLKGRIGWQGLRASEFVEEGAYLITGTDFNSGKIEWNTCYHVTESRFREAPYIHIKNDDLLITKDGTIGKVAYVKDCPDKAVLNSGIFLLRCRDNSYTHKFAYHVLNSHIFDDFLRKNLNGSTINHLYQNVFEKFPFPLPQQNVQKRIATILDCIDQTIEETEALIHKYQQIKAGLMHDLFTRGLTADGKLRPPREQAPELYQETPIGWIPKEWEIDSIGNLFHIQLGKMLSKAAKTGNWSAPYLGNKNVQWDRVDITNLEKMDFKPIEREKFKLITGDLLVCEGGDVGRTSIWRDEIEVCFYQKAIHRLRPIKERIKPELMLRIMRHAKRTGVFTDFTSQSSIAHLTQEQLARVKMFIPQLGEQSLMIERFDRIDNKINAETALLEKLKVQKSGLMHDLLTGKMPVKVDQAETTHV